MNRQSVHKLVQTGAPFTTQTYVPEGAKLIKIFARSYESPRAFFRVFLFKWGVGGATAHSVEYDIEVPSGTTFDCSRLQLPMTNMGSVPTAVGHVAVAVTPGTDTSCSFVYVN